MPARQRPPSAARALLPDRPDLDGLRAAAANCQACDLYRDATQTVFGEGTTGAEVMLVGEQPGDGEDRATVHPSSILRAPDDEARALAYKGFVADLAVAAGELGRGSPSE